MSLTLEGVSKTYEDGAILDAIDLDVAPGDLLCVVGPTGSGKSTLLRIVSGLEAPDAGRVRIGDVDVTDVPAPERRIGMVFQDAALFAHLDVRGNLGFGLRLRKVTAREARVDEVAGRLGLSELLDRSVGTLSGGERQRVALGRALLRDPDVLLLDEPLQALDARVGAEIREQILAVRSGITTVWVTHDQDEALAVGDRVAVLSEGRLEQCGTPEDVYERPATVFVARFCGRDPMNVLADGDGSVGFRAEDATIGEGSGLRIEGRVTRSTYRGTDTLVTVETSRGPVVIRTASPPPVRSSIVVCVPSGRLHRFGPDGRRR